MKKDKLSPPNPVRKPFIEWIRDMSLFQVKDCDNLTINTRYHSVTMNPRGKTGGEIADEFNRKLSNLGSEVRIISPE